MTVLPTAEGAAAAGNPDGSIDRSARPAPLASLLVATLSWTLAAVSLLALPFTDPTWHPGQWFFLVDFADALVFGGVASVLLARGRHPVAWILAACAIGGGLAALGFQWSMVLVVHPDLPSLDPLSAMQNTAWIPGTLAVILVLPWLVRSTPLRPVDRVFVAAGAILIAVCTMARLTDPFPWPDGPTIAPFAIRSEWWSGILEDSFPWQMGALCLLSYVAAADVVRRWRRDPVAGRGLGWLAVAVVLMTSAFIPLALPETWVQDLPVWFTPVLHLASQLFFPAALLVAVLGQRLRGLHLAVDRATVYGLLTGAVVAVYLLVVWALGTVLPDGQVPGLIGVAVVAAGIQPGRRWLQTRVDHLVRGHSATPLDALSRVGARLGAAGEHEMADVVAEAVRSSFRLGGVAIDVDWPTGARRLAQAGTLADEVVTVALVVQQEHVGDLTVGPRRGERLDRASVESIESLAPVVAATVQLVARTRALAESRARIAEARDEERRRLRRELHDGFGPALAGVGLGLQASRSLLRTDPAAAEELLARLAGEVDERVEEVRTLARGLLPPVLEELGLAPAIRELADRHRLNEGLEVHVDLDPGAAVDDAERRGALYGIVAEAVRNVVRHAGATRCDIALRVHDGEVLVSVRDDGTGIAADAAPGVGLRSMHERAEAVGAILTIVAAPEGGTVVEVRLPVRNPLDEVTA